MSIIKMSTSQQTQKNCIYTTSAQRLRRWTSIVYMLYKCFLFAGITCVCCSSCFSLPDRSSLINLITCHEIDTDNNRHATEKNFKHSIILTHCTFITLNRLLYWEIVKMITNYYMINKFNQNYLRNNKWIVECSDDNLLWFNRWSTGQSQ